MTSPGFSAQHTYRVQACDLLTGRSLGYELPLVVTSMSRGINDSGGALTATASLRTNFDLANILIARKTVIWVWRDEVPVWGGILWTVDPDPIGETVTIGCEGFTSYLRRVKLLSDQTFTNVDQLDIARALVDYAQGQANARLNYGFLNSAHTVNDTGGSNVGLTYGADTSGVLRTRTAADGYAAAQGPIVMDLLTNLAGVINGFQWYEDLQWAGPGTMPTPYIYWGYPQLSRSLPLRLTYPGNVASYDFAIDGTSSVNRYIVLGATDAANNTLRSIRNNAVELAAGFPILMGDSGSSYTDVSVAATLDQHAVEDLATVEGNAIAFTVVARGDLFRKFSVGDTLQTSFTSLWHKTPFEVPLQCVSWELAPASTGQDEALTLAMAPIRQI